jgi:hypothetical protein
MKKSIFCILTTMIVGALFADAITDKEKKLAERDKRIMEKHGGFISRPGTPSGKIVVVNMQKSVPFSELKKVGEQISIKVRGVVAYAEGDSVDIATAVAKRNELKADVAIFIIDDKNFPMSLIAPEAQWGFCNISPLKDGVKDSRQLALRASTQFARVFGMICGGISSQFNSRIMNEIRKPSDLDGVVPELPVDITAKFVPYLEKRGVRPEKRTVYRRACQEGWAPQPTNSFQKAVWDEVHSLPTKPITIKYDKKKGE